LFHVPAHENFGHVVGNRREVAGHAASFVGGSDSWPGCPAELYHLPRLVAATLYSFREVAMQRPIAALSGALLLIVLVGAASLAAGKTLDIYFIDTEGGPATLLVSPAGETLMIDVGFAGLDTPNPDKDLGRDAARIADVAKLAKVARIDTLLVTHFHGDHASG